MAIEPTPDPLQRAVRAARSDSPRGWIELSTSIMSQVRSIVTPAQPILAFTEDGRAMRDEAHSRTYVSARAVTAALRRLLQRPTHAPNAIDLAVESNQLTGVRVELVCRYGGDLLELGDRVRADIVGQLRTLLGKDPAFDMAQVSVVVVDVVEGDPTVT